MEIEPLKEGKIKKVHQTNYFQTFTHILKANIGSCIFALSNAYKSSGILFGPLMTILLSIICVDQQHVLINCADKLSEDFKVDHRLDYAETLELSLKSNKRLNKYAKVMKKICNSFLVITQCGFCAVYFLLIGANLKNILDFYGFEIELKTLMVISFIPILATALVTNLKYLTPFSLVGTLCMILTIAITFYYSIQDLPSISERKLIYTETHQLPLFIGTIMYLYEGIGMVLPLRNSMKRPKEFSSSFGVLNVGMAVLTVLFLTFGCVGYWKYGEDVQPSLSLNLPIDKIIVQFVVVMIAIGAMLGFSLQLYIAIQVMYPHLKSSLKFCKNHPLIGELIFRIFMTFVTFSMALSVPNLGLLISMIGAICSPSLAFVFPVIINISIKTAESKINLREMIKNAAILSLAIIAVLSGIYESIKEIEKLYL